MKRNEKRVWPVVLTAVIITLIALWAVFGQDILQYLGARDTQRELQDLYKGSGSGSLWDLLIPVAYAQELSEETAEEDVIEKVIHEDFSALYDQNPHVVGWLIAGEDIDYPVVQYDNEYYLEHDFFGREDRNGTLFVNGANRLDPRDSILLIHGHNMKSGAMFGDMDFFRDDSYLQEYPIVTFRTIWDEQDVYYVPVAAFDASMDPDSEGYFKVGRIRFEFDIPAEDENGKPRSTQLEEHLAQMRSMSLWDVPIEADSTDEYIMLITCSYSHENGRMMMLCRKLREGEDEQSIRALLAEE